MANRLVSKDKIKAALRGVLAKLCKVPLKDDKTEDEQYQDWIEKRQNADRQKRFRDKWQKECKIGTPSGKPNPKKPTDVNKIPITKQKKTAKKKSPYG